VTARLTIHGECFVTLSSVAECFHVHSAWIREVYDFGLLGRGEHVGDDLAIAAAQLDRVATIQRLHRHYGLDLATIEIVLESGASRGSGS
jgi:hypothetical protein